MKIWDFNSSFPDKTIFFNFAGRLESTLYVKLKGIRTLLHKASFHPESYKRGIIHSQSLHCRQKITDDTNLRKQLCTLRDNLHKKECNLSEIHTQFKKVENLIKRDLLDKKKAKDTNNKRLPFMIPYDHTTIQIRPILKKYWQIISCNEALNWILGEPTFLALKRHKNTKGIRVHSEIEAANKWFVTNNGKIKITTGATVDWNPSLLGAPNT